MDEDKKKPVLIGLIVGSLVLAGVVTVMTRSDGPDGIDSIPEDETVWVTCRAEQCGANYEMQKREFYRQLEEEGKKNPGMALVTPALICTKCSKPSAYMAYKCLKCGLVFEGGNFKGDFVDKCPAEGCGYSDSERRRNEKAPGGGA